jgi:hypothetical protein
MPDQNKKYAVYCAIAIVAGAAVGTMAFFGSERSDAKDARVRFAAKFHAAPMQRLRASPRHNALSSPAIMTKSQQKLLKSTGDSSMKRLALAAMSKRTMRTSVVKMQVEAMADADKAELEQVKETVLEKAKKMAGITEPLGFFDPVGFCSEEGLTEGKLCFYREVELKHGRVAMLASLGFLVGEQFHPLFGGGVDVPSYLAFQQTPLQTFWPAVVAAIAIPEIFSVFSFNAPFSDEQYSEDSQPWSIRTDRVAGDLGFDPLGLKPTDPKEFKEMQTKELNNGRLAMIAAAGMVAQELASGQKLF